MTCRFVVTSDRGGALRSIGLQEGAQHASPEFPRARYMFAFYLDFVLWGDMTGSYGFMVVKVFCSDLGRCSRANGVLTDELPRKPHVLRLGFIFLVRGDGRLVARLLRSRRRRSKTVGGRWREQGLFRVSPRPWRRARIGPYIF